MTGIKAARPKGAGAVMAQRAEPPDSLDFFPTPPWATRALCEHVLRLDWTHKWRVWEPAAGKGHMAAVLEEYFVEVRASDVFDYGYAPIIGSFVGDGPDSVMSLKLTPVDWIITNPPFRLAVEFAERAIELAEEGVALLVRSVWAEGGDRYRRLFRDRPPTLVAQFAERVPMTQGRWDPDATTATSYAWFVWIRSDATRATRLVWIAPGCREGLTRPDDRQRFAAWSMAEPLAGVDLPFGVTTLQRRPGGLAP